jgi:hypothetical protein
MVRRSLLGKMVEVSAVEIDRIEVMLQLHLGEAPGLDLSVESAEVLGSSSNI